MTTMLTIGEQQELRQIEQGLRDVGRGFAVRLAVLQGVLRWAAPGQRACLRVLAILAAALLRLAATAGRLLAPLAEGAMLMEPTALMALGDGAWLGWAFGPEPDHDASAAQDRTPVDSADLT